MHGELYSLALIPHGNALRKPGTRLDLNLSWHPDVTEKLVDRHNRLPSKGNFYRTSFKYKTRRKYEPYHSEELRLLTARAVGKANSLHKELQSFIFDQEEDSFGDRKVSCAASSAKATKAGGGLNGNIVKDKHLK